MDVHIERMGYMQGKNQLTSEFPDKARASILLWKVESNSLYLSQILNELVLFAEASGLGWWEAEQLHRL